MSSNRHVPLIIGIVAIGTAIWLIVGLAWWWRFIPSTLLLMFGWVSLKTGLSASDKELRELTGVSPMSSDTEHKLRDRV